MLSPADSASAFTCYARNRDNALLSNEGDYICTFFSSYSYKSAGNGAISIRIYEATKLEVEKLGEIDSASAPSSDPATGDYIKKLLCDFTIIAADGKATAVTEESGCKKFIVPEDMIVIGDNSWSARIIHNSTFAQEKTTATALLNSQLAMYQLPSGTWFSSDGTSYFNSNILGLMDTADLEPDVESGALALGTALFASSLTMLAF